jgi:hypothetical protein
VVDEIVKECKVMADKLNLKVLHVGMNGNRRWFPQLMSSDWIIGTYDVYDKPTTERSTFFGKLGILTLDEGDQIMRFRCHEYNPNEKNEDMVKDLADLILSKSDCDVPHKTTVMILSATLEESHFKHLGPESEFPTGKACLASVQQGGIGLIDGKLEVVAPPRIHTIPKQFLVGNLEREIPRLLKLLENQRGLVIVRHDDLPPEIKRILQHNGVLLHTSLEPNNQQNVLDMFREGERKVVCLPSGQVAGVSEEFDFVLFIGSAFDSSTIIQQIGRLGRKGDGHITGKLGLYLNLVDVVKVDDRQNQEKVMKDLGIPGKPAEV